MIKLAFTLPILLCFCTACTPTLFRPMHCPGVYDQVALWEEERDRSDEDSTKYNAIQSTINEIEERNIECFD